MKKIFVFLFCVWFLNCSIEQARAQANPISIMQQTMGGTLRQFLIKRGFAANDPRFGATFTGISGTIAAWASGAVALVGAAVTAPAWLTAAIGSIGVPIAKDLGEAAATWLWYKNNPLKVVVHDPRSTPANTPAMTVNGPYMYISVAGQVRYQGTDANSLASQYVSSWGTGYQSGGCSVQSATQYYCVAWKYDAVKDQWNYNAGSFNVQVATSGAQHACQGGFYWDDGGCKALNPIYPANNDVPVPIQTAVNTIPGLDMAKQVNPQVIANTLNNAWKETAAKPGYTGLPYDYTNPVTVADVDAWASVHPDIYPKVQDWVKPQDPVVKPFVIPNTTTPVTDYDPNTNTNTGSNPAGASQAQINLGPDPGIPAPQMEDIPTPQSILKPILDLLPDLKNFQAQATGGECPKPSFEAFEHTFTIEKHCDLAEQNRTAIKAGMMVVFALASLMIVLRA